MSNSKNTASVGWDYGRDLPPERWCERFPEAAGNSQSPIAISRDSVVENPGLGPVTPDYADDDRLGIRGFFFKSLHFEVEIADPDHAGGVRIGTSQDLAKILNFHIHTPAEHPLDGHSALMEIHIVHQDPSDAQKRVVVGLFVEAGGEDNPIVAKLRGLLPDLIFEGLPEAFDKKRAKSSLNDGFPASRPFFRYEGSLTTPPCSEVVTFYLIDRPIYAKATTIEEFAKYIPGGNNRPLQPGNGRTLEYFPTDGQNVVSP